MPQPEGRHPGWNKKLESKETWLGRRDKISGKYTAKPKRRHDFQISLKQSYFQVDTKLIPCPSPNALISAEANF
jgi:hypothetical protein